MASQALLARLLAFKASLVTLRADVIHSKEARWTDIEALAIQVERQWLTRVCETLPTLRWVLQCTVHAWPITF